MTSLRAYAATATVLNYRLRTRRISDDDRLDVYEGLLITFTLALLLAITCGYHLLQIHPAQA
jgi:hypothetical protein